MKIIEASTIANNLSLNEDCTFVNTKGDIILNAKISSTKNLFFVAKGKIFTTCFAGIASQGDISLISEEAIHNQGCTINGGKNMQIFTDYLYNGKDRKNIMHQELQSKYQGLKVKFKI